MTTQVSPTTQAPVELPPDLHQPQEGVRPEGDFPEAATGIAGFLERFTGPHATQSDRIGLIAASLIAGTVARRSVIAAHPSAGLGEEISALAAGGSLAGGAFAGSSPRARAWFRPTSPDVTHVLSFTAVHVHPMAVSVFAPSGERGRAFIKGALLYAATLGATALVATRPPEERQMWSWGSTAALSAASLTALRMPRGWEWLGPAYTTRLIVGHADTT